MMKVPIRATLAGMILASVFFASEPHAGPQLKGICPVCQATEGGTDEEPIKATRTYEGKVYGFCSEKCAVAFVADPIAYMPPRFPRPAPRFALSDLNGTEHSNGNLKGRVVLLDFWATWCAPCKTAMPELQRLHTAHSGRGFTVLGVSIDEGGAAKVKRYVDSKKITYPVAMDDGESPAWDAFRVKAIPAAFLIDREGRIVSQWTGAPPKMRDLETKLNELLALD